MKHPLFGSKVTCTDNQETYTFIEFITGSEEQFTQAVLIDSTGLVVLKTAAQIQFKIEDVDWSNS